MGEVDDADDEVRGKRQRGRDRRHLDGAALGHGQLEARLVAVVRVERPPRALHGQMYALEPSQTLALRMTAAMHNVTRCMVSC